MASTLEEVIDNASKAPEAQVVDECDVQIGGVDPLGLRQINFDMMDQVLPGLNNVARHVRPYLLMSWAWRRCNQLVRKHKRVSVKDMRDFVDRIETIYAWSQFAVDRETDLPGSSALAFLVQTESYTFSGKAWEKFRDTRRYSTGLIAAVNYGPGLRNMRWIADLSSLEGNPITEPGAYKTNPEGDPALEEALDAFEECMAAELDHPAFNVFGKVTVELEDVKRWGELWQMDQLTEQGRTAAWRRINAGEGRSVRSKGLELVRYAALHDTDGVNDTNDVRRLMANPDGIGFPEDLLPFAARWRRMQVRQVLRLALEGLLYWCQGELQEAPLTTRQLALRFLDEAGGYSGQHDALAWIEQFEPGSDPIEHLDRISACFGNGEGLATALISALRFCIAEAPDEPQPFERPDRLPLVKAAREWKAWADLLPAAFISRLLEGWIFAQHTYWSVGRGLQDARGNGKMILRLRLFIDEGGWRLAQGIGQGTSPNATPDRLETALSLLHECDQLQSTDT
ncbi:hypothetical protein GCM10009127_08460 [Alteraurantiacibacter aestuarii]|uniref:Septum formation inhibitor-activating ATPase n=1 Tax=Alteraurantiacibacter aestuarii TaxID=650004 RepID=A0A844ZK07_9SPHN|nr:septum formation inhibitor-activating ATPase [Alteraurantiacibacter aestuarii]MXO87237.1 septum formation inhibitor-activating ATPase [Alteraurantiacibacter aestuarii]